MSRPTSKRIRSFDDHLPEPSPMSYPKRGLETRGGAYPRYHGVRALRWARDLGSVETPGRFKCFIYGGWLLGPKGVPSVPVGAPLNEAVQHVTFPPFLRVQMSRHGYEGADGTVQGLAGLLPEGKAVSNGRQRFVGDENAYQGRHQNLVGGGWGGDALLDPGTGRRGSSRTRLRGRLISGEVGVWGGR